MNIKNFDQEPFDFEFIGKGELQIQLSPELIIQLSKKAVELGIDQEDLIQKILSNYLIQSQIEDNN
jgi:hypothetical protein